jgi:hypothetical protein
MAVRQQELFAAHRQSIFVSTDRLFLGLLTLQGLLAIVFAIWVAPNTWIGQDKDSFAHILRDLSVLMAASIFLIAIILTRPGASRNRYFIAVGQMLISAMLIHLTGGRIETHFHVFGSLAFLSFYRDWRLLIPDRSHWGAPFGDGSVFAPGGLWRGGRGAVALVGTCCVGRL